MKSRFPIFFLFLLGAVAPSLEATVTIEFTLGQLDVPAGTVGILVADSHGDGFTSPTDAIGTILSTGMNLAGSDDVIISTVQADDGGHWNGQAGFSETLAAIDYEALGIDAGMSLVFYWFPDHQTPGSVLANGDEWHAFRETAPANGGGTIGFVAPADWGTYRISQLAPGLGGDFNPADPASSGEYDEGLIGDELPAPGNVTATDGAHPDKVVVSWDTVADAISYDIYRNTTADFGGAGMIGNTTNLNTSDPSAGAGTIYFYWILAKNADGDGPPSAPDTGWKALAPVGNLTIESLAGKVRLSWTAVPEALRYRILRSESGDLGEAILLDTISGTAFEDETAVLGIDYTYWVESANDETASPAESATGSSAEVRPDLTIGEKTTRLKGDNLYNTSGSGQKLTEKTTNARKVKVYAELQNDNAASDAIRLATGRGNNYFTVKVIRLSNGFANITAAAKAGIYTSDPLAEGDRESIRIEIKPKRSKVKDKNKRYTLTARGFSNVEAFLSDTVKVKTVHRK